MKSILASLLLAAGAASAQQSVWGQCGGQGWSGPTTCVSGSVCTFQNNWYSQCLPGTGPPPAATTTTARSTTLSTSIRTTTSTLRPTSTAAPPPAGTGFPTASGTRFTIDGVTKYFAGTNCYWCTAGGISNADIDLVFDHLRSSGIKILRVWGFNDVNTIPSGNQVWFQHLSASGSTINTGDNGLGRIDAVVRAAERTGIKLIIPLVNNWDDYGGYSAYVRAFGGTKQTWYTNAAAQAQYRRYAEAVISRHRTSKAILAWELANEPRCQGCNVNVITEWAKSTSEFFKSIAPSHMVTLGDEGFGLPGENSYPYGYSEGTDWVALLAIKTLDFATFHLYPNSWSTTYDWGNKWIKDHAALCAAANKPCLLEEYGAPSRHCEIERPWQLTSVAAPGMAGDAFWQLGDTLSTGPTHDDGNTIYYNSADWTCLVTNHIAAIG